MAAVRTPSSLAPLALRLGAVALLVSSACATTTKKVQEKKAWTAVDYYPVGVGNAWAYMVTNHGGPNAGSNVLLTTQMIDVTETTFTIKSGDEPITYERRPDGVFKPKSGYHMLKDPIAQGASWTIPGGMGTVTVTAVDEEVKVTAGKFMWCITVVEELGGIQRAEWTYAPEVGPVRMRIYDLKKGAPALVVSGELRGFQLDPPAEDLPGAS